jgi:hypothetical protein
MKKLFRVKTDRYLNRRIPYKAKLQQKTDQPQDAQKNKRVYGTPPFHSVSLVHPVVNKTAE